RRGNGSPAWSPRLKKRKERHAAAPDVAPASLRLSRYWLTLIRIPGSDLVERRVRDFVAVDLRRPLDHALQRVQHGGIGVAAIGLGVLFVLPQADRERFGAIGGEKGDLILEPGLLAQHREHVIFEGAGEFGGLVGLEMQRNVACEHTGLLALRQRELRGTNTTTRLANATGLY